jgi:galactonate dehydratase
MKVEDIKVLICHAFRTNWVFVKVITDQGLYGVGESTLEMRELTVAKAIEELKRDLVGQDPAQIERFWHDAYRDAYWRGGPVLMSALAGIEMALWDLKGKKLGVPVYELLGGKVRDSVPCYANGWFASARTPADFATKAKEAVATGFRALKWDPFGVAYMSMSRNEFEAAMDCVRAVREAVGDEVDLMIEGHGRFNIPTAFQIGLELGKYNVKWFEEPIPPDNLEGLAELKRRISVPIAAGERIYGRWDYKRFLELSCVDYVQPDVSHVGGIFELKKIAAMAECRHIPLCPHNPSGPVANAATLQIAACTPNFLFLETMITDVWYRREVASEKLDFKNGQMSISSAPGLGVDIDEEEIAKHPYKPRCLRHYKGTLTDIRPTDSKPYYHNCISSTKVAIQRR